MTRNRRILLLAIAAASALVGCDKAPAPGEAAAIKATTANTSRTPVPSRTELPTVTDVAAQPQPKLQTLDFAPVGQDFAPGDVVLHAPNLDVQIDRVSYGPYGMAIELEVHQHKSDFQTFLNGGDEGVLRDDAGNVYRLREDEHMLNLHMGKRGDVWKATLYAYGFVPAAAKAMTLSLNVAPFGGHDTLVEASWPVPAGLASRRRMHRQDIVEPGRGWRFAEPRTAMDAKGEFGVRVYGIAWLRDGIAVDMELVNGRRGSALPLYRARLIDDHGHESRLFQHDRASGSVIRMGAGEGQAGRFLLTPQIAPDARSLTLELGSGSPAVKLDLGPIPATSLPALPMPENADRAARFAAYREEAATFALPNSQLDRVAQLKQALEAVDDRAGTRVALPGDVLFDFDKATLRGDAGATLDKLAELITRLGRPAHITGYTDSKGDDAYNLKLSRERARSVHDALLARNVDAKQLADPRGRGEADPKADNTRADGSDNPEGRRLNRRVEVLIEPAPAHAE